MSRAQIKFFFDLQSPYSYLAYYYLRTAPQYRECKVEFIPILTLGLVKAGVGLPPWQNPRKVAYLTRDLERSAMNTNVPWISGWPANYPNTSTVYAQRYLTACAEEYPAKFPSLLDAFFKAFWLDKKAMQDPKVFLRVAEEFLGDSIMKRLYELSSTEEIKAKLRTTTEKALEDGLFGLPWFAVTVDSREDVFWGFDRMPALDKSLDLKTDKLARI